MDLIVEAIVYLQTEGRRLARGESQRLGVSPTQLSVLKLVDELGELSLSELSRRIAAQNSTVTGIVDRLVGANLVVREQSEKDRRVWRIRLTERGRKIAREADLAPWALLREALEQLTPDEEETLVAILNKMAAHVRRRAGEVEDT